MTARQWTEAWAALALRPQPTEARKRRVGVHLVRACNRAGLAASPIQRLARHLGVPSLRA